MRARPELRASYHPDALEEIEADVRHYRKIDRENGGGTLAADFLAAIVGADWKIASASHRWAPYLYGTRRLLLPKRWPFGLIYLPEEPPKVIALAHDRRRPGYWRDRLED